MLELKAFISIFIEIAIFPSKYSNVFIDILDIKSEIR